MSETSNAELTLPESGAKPASDRLLESALVVFSRYGFRRTGMGLVADQAGMSRPAVYLRYANKDALFQAVAEHLVDRALADAEAAWAEEATLADNLAAMILAKDLPIFRLLKTTPHGAELMQVDAELTAAGHLRLQSGFLAILAGRLERLAAQGRIALAPHGGAGALAQLVFRAASGLKHEVEAEADYVATVQALARVFDRSGRSA